MTRARICWLLLTLVASTAGIGPGAAHAAHYGTVPLRPAPTSPMLSIADHLPICHDATSTCIETTGAVRAYPVADGDHVTLHWSNDAGAIDGVIRLGNLYLPMSQAATHPATPVTLEIELPAADRTAQVIVDYAGTRHHVPLSPGTWQPLSIYNPDEQVLYLRLDLPPAPPSN